MELQAATQAADPIEDDRDPVATRPDGSIWENCHEVDQAVTDIEGTLPRGLVGTLLRNGPAKRDLSRYFWDGDGMVRALQFTDAGEVRYRSRYVQTPKYLAERNATRPLFRSGGTQRPGGVLANALRMPATEANTHLLSHAGKLHALHEGGPPFELDPRTLQTLGPDDYDGVLPKGQPFNAHPHLDPETGEVFGFGMVPGRGGARVRPFRIDGQGRMHRLPDVQLASMTFMHDFALSSRWLAFFEPPLSLSLPRMLLGLESVFDSFRWRPGRTGYVHLLSRDGRRRMRFETEPFLLGHVIAARDLGSELQIDFVRGPSWTEVQKGLLDFRTGELPFMQEMCTWRLRLDTTTGRVESEQLDGRPADFPRHHEGKALHNNRYSYFAANPRPRMQGFFRGTMKLDLDSGRSDFFDFGRGFLTHEALFVPKPGAKGEDTGWLLQYVHNNRRRATDCAIFDARKLSDGPVCTVRLPVSAGMTFHGTWVA